ncbi:MAG: DUF87 domain-containing protein [Alphaproteobacteria bacterium]|nr:DUF87 domain-containing protein [Alphaproteobacteria bacterium]MBF0128377.1 DUF87 domain-containing protein [Alphaproteobacteria bacterium]
MSNESSIIGSVVSVSGSAIRCLLNSEPGSDGAPTSADLSSRIGALVKTETPESTVYGIVNSLEIEAGSGRRIALADLLGETLQGGSFQRGVSIHPMLGARVMGANSDDIGRVYAKPSAVTLRIGAIHQDRAVPAYILPNETLGKHFAVLGTTGSGKSCTVALLLRAILTKNPNGHVVLLDPHAEYAHAFGDLTEVIDPSTLSLPCWLLNFEETVAVMVIAGAAAEREAQIGILKEAILQAKRKFAGDNEDGATITVDTPVPYRIGDLLRIIDNNMGKLDKADNSAPFLRLKSRIESLNSDRRFAFMFSGVMVRDNMAAVVSRILRIPVAGKPLTIMDLSGVPSEVVDVVVSVLCRAIFDFALWKERSRSLPVLLVCEEAHRYVPARDDLGFRSTKVALSRIAKEGRKYGVSLCLVTQRPSELDSSILSQCGTLFALRMGNQQDQDFVSRALPDSARGLLSVLPSLRPQEAVVVGEGVSVPMRVHFDALDEAHRPRSGTAEFCAAWQEDAEGLPLISETIARWRAQHR